MLDSMTIRLIILTHPLQTDVSCFSCVLLKLGGSRLTYWDLDVSYPAGAAAGSCFLLVSSFLSCRRSRRILFPTRFFFLLTLPAQPQGTVSYSFLLSSSSSSSFFFFFLLSSGNTSFSHTSLHLILTKLAHSDRYLDHYSGTDNGGVRGHDGVTGVKKVIFTKKASSPTEYLALMRDLCIWIRLTPSTKVMVLKIHPGSFGVTGVKRSFSPKRHQVLQNT